MSEAVSIRTVVVANRQGLHLRAATLLAERARRFQAKVEMFTGDRRRAQTTDVLQMTSMGVTQGTELQLVATGADAEAALDALAELFRDRFGEDQEGEATPEGRG
jgi:phosphotransferase system HPr (HPr) family protein